MRFCHKELIQEACIPGLGKEVTLSREVEKGCRRKKASAGRPKSGRGVPWKVSTKREWKAKGCLRALRE